MYSMMKDCPWGQLQDKSLTLESVSHCESKQFWSVIVANIYSSVTLFALLTMQDRPKGALKRNVKRG